MTALFLRVLWISLTTSMVLLPLLLFAQKLAERYRAKSCYLLWLLLAVRLLLPFELPLPRPAVTVEMPAYILLRTSGTHPTVPTAPLPEPSVSAVALPSLPEVCALIWLVGAAVVLIWHLWVSFALKSPLRTGARRLAEDQRLLTSLGGDVPVLRCSVGTPMTMGLLRPVILLPDILPEDDLPLILEHELRHLRRGDLWYKALFLLCAALHWFNPLVWLLGRAAGEAAELCCDEDVVAGQDESFRRRYGAVLLRAAAIPGPALSTCLGSGNLKGRIMNLFITKKQGAALVCTAVCAALLMGSLVGCDTASAAETDPIPEVSDTIQAEPGKDLVLDVDSTQLPEAETVADPWLWPVDGEYTLSALYGTRVHPITGTVTEHSGIDIVAVADTPVLTAQSGTVEESEFDRELGNYVLIAHADGTKALYGGLKQAEVSAGETVTQGQTIGLVGQTGMSTGPHLHLEVHDAEGNPTDPLDRYPEYQLVASSHFDPPEEWLEENGYTDPPYIPVG